MATIQISRPKKKDRLGPKETFYLYLNDLKIGKIRSGETNTVPVDAGIYKLSADCGPLDFSFRQAITIEIKDGETTNINIDYSKKTKRVFAVSKWVPIWWIGSYIVVGLLNQYIGLSDKIIGALLLVAVASPFPLIFIFPVVAIREYLELKEL